MLEHVLLPNNIMGNNVIAKHYSIASVGGILCILSSFDGHLWCSHFLATINNSATNCHVQVFVWNMFSILLSVYLGVKLLSLMATLYLIT